MNTLKQLFKGRNSADTAKQRLRFVLIHDRAEIPPGVLELIKDDIIAVISRRLPIDRTSVSVNIDHAGDENRLLVDIPLLAEDRRRSDSAKRRSS
jgi:cell division topological specificity factor